MSRMVKKNILTFFLVLFVSLSFSQTTKIYGIVKRGIDGSPLPFVNIVFQNTSIGAISDFEGSFAIETDQATDTLILSCVGYYPIKVSIRKQQYQELSIMMYESDITLAEVVIRPGENPAEVLLKRVIENKSMNGPDRASYYQVEIYNKIQFDANNIDDKFMKRRAMRPFTFVFDNMDTSTVNGKVYLPLFISESISSLYFQKNPRSTREFIHGVKISGLDNESVAQYLGNMYQNINVYDNHIKIFDKNFVSPIAGFGLSYYKYYLVDSAFVGPHWCYNIMFEPRRKQELTFSGNMWIDDSTYAIKQYEMRIVNDANINFVNDLLVAQEFEIYDDAYWMISRDALVIDFNVLQDNQKGTMGFYGHKSTSYRDYIFEKPLEQSFYNNPERIVVDDSAYFRADSFWSTERHDSLGKEEIAIYNMVDSVKSMPVFNTYLDFINMFLTGYYVWGKFEMGPYMSMFSFNEVEGNRLRFGGRTSNDFSKRVMPSAYVAYGTKDQAFKYGLGIQYMIDKNPRRVFSANYKHDMEQLGMSPTGFREDFLLASFITRNPANKLSMVNELKSYYEHEWFTGFSNTIRFLHKDIFPVGDTVFNFGSGENPSRIAATEVSLDVRFAYRERFLYGEFTRTSMGTKYPIIQVRYSRGIKDLWAGDFNYSKLSININDWFNLGVLGWSKYVIDAGKVWGSLPYPFLKLHEGNETYFFDETSFNTMNYFEFVSDRWVSIYYTHRFDGLFLNKIPLMRKLKWREVVWTKMLWGDLNIINRNFSSFPEGMFTLGKPFVEAGAGIENIFKFLRIDGVWRLSYLDHPNIAKFQIMFGMQVFF